MKSSPASCSEAGGERPCPLKTLHHNPPSAPHPPLSLGGCSGFLGCYYWNASCSTYSLSVQTCSVCLGPHRPPLSSSLGNIILKINAGSIHTSLLPLLCLLACSLGTRGPSMALLSPRVLPWDLQGGLRGPPGLPRLASSETCGHLSAP